MNTPFRFPILVLSAVLLAACGGTPEPLPGHAPPAAMPMAATADSLSVPLLRSSGWATFDSVYRYPSLRVTAAELDSGLALFSTCFRQAEGVPLTNTEHEVPWDVLTAHLPARTTGNDRAVLFHYGLNAPAFRVAWAYRTVAQAPNPDGLHDLDYTDHRAYEWTSTGLATAQEDDWVWAHQQQPNGRTYFNAVQINRLQQGDLADHWDAVHSYDANACLLHWERELERMYADNAAQFEGQEEHLVLVVSCTAEWREDEAHSGPYIAHTITTHLRLKVPGQPVQDLITNDPEDPTAPYLNRGADYGNLCPVRCGEVEVR